MDGTDDLPVFDDDDPWEAVEAGLAAADIGDGLPVVPPTRRRLDAMLAAVREPDRSFGPVPPLFGDLTPRAVAYHCVLAGCRPAELPVVLTAVAAALEPAFNLLGIQTTTGTPTVAVAVHGPLAARLGMNAGTNCLGPGNRANAAVGRAVQLVLVHVGGARPGIGDMATMGQPGKYAFCFAESGDPAFPPLHVRRGLSPEVGAVTVMGVSGTAEILPADGRDTTEAILAPVAVAMAAGRRLGGPAIRRPPGEQVFLLPPELVGLLAGHGWGLAETRRYLHAARCTLHLGDAAAEDAALPVAASPEDIHPIVTGGPGIKMTYLPLWMGGTRTVTRPILDP
ncbi:MAG: hypothetical protein ACK4QW_04470 [Alphaproteobacteria bacterium]